MAANFFTLDGTTSLDMGMYISGKNTYGGAVRDIETISIPGRNGDVVIDHGRYKNATIVYNCMVKNMDDATEARDWLMAHSNAYYKLSDTYHTSGYVASDEYRLARVSDVFEPSTVTRTGMVVFEVHFDCDPRRFLTSGDDETKIASGGSLTLLNPTYQIALPEIRMAWSGTINFSSASVSSSITVGSSSNSFSSVIVNCETRRAYTKSGTTVNNLNAYLSLGNNGVWPTLEHQTVIENKTTGNIWIKPHWWRI